MRRTAKQNSAKQGASPLTFQNTRGRPARRNPVDSISPPPAAALEDRSNSRSPSPPKSDDSTEVLLKQPDTRAISQEQLVAEVKGIYAGLVMVESKCIEVDTSQGQPDDPDKRLNDQQWQAMIALHRTLLQEHHDFFMASQHPSASAALRRLVAKYQMPARMWRHGIHSFLELLRHRLPGTLDHMLTFIYMAYSMMALLYETVPAFEETWIECLGDLGRYRMAIEDDIGDREVWTAVSRQWYSLASDKAPTTGKLYHHLAILSRSSASQPLLYYKQLSYYTKSLCVEIPFPSARESIMTLFEPIMSRKAGNGKRAKLPPELSLVKTHGILFSGKHQDEFDGTMKDYIQQIDSDISRPTRRWLESGYHTAIANIGALTGYGDESNPINVARKADARLRRPDDAEPIDQLTQGAARSETTTSAKSGNNNSNNNNNNGAKTIPNPDQFDDALKLNTKTYNAVCRRFGDPNILGYLHVNLVFLLDLSFLPDAMALVEYEFPWKLTALMLNTFLTAPDSATPNVSQALARLLDPDAPFPGTEVGGSDKTGEKAPPVRRRRPLPDDYAMRGFQWAERYHLPRFFETEERIDDDDKYVEVPSMMEERRDRVLWLGARITEREGGRWLRLDREAMRFGWNPEYEKVEELTPTPGESVELGELPDADTVA